jgi:hypothetical protein
MFGKIKNLYAQVRVVRMSDGHVAIIRDLGLVKGGRGLRHHERLMSFRF